MKHTISISFRCPEDSMSGKVELDLEQALAVDIEFGASADPVVMTLEYAIDPAYLKAMAIVADQNGTLTFKDDGDVVRGAINLVAGKPFIAFLGTNPDTDMGSFITDPVTKLSWVNTSDPLAAGTVKFRAGIDPTV